MEYRPPFQLGPTSTPSSLKILLLITAILSIFSSWLGPYLALSLHGIEQGFIWQLATYVFIHPFPSGVVQLALNLYLIWTFGSSLIERLHLTPFFILYFGSTLFAGLFALLGMSLTHTSVPLAGTTPVVFSLLISWTLLNPEARLLMFFTLPFKARHLILGLMGMIFLVNISNARWAVLFTDIGSILFGYLFTLIACRIRSPFPFLEFFENGVLRSLEKLGSWRKKRYTHTKVYDIKSGAPVLNDEQFMDAMLSRISLYGEEILTPEEKQRMNQISNKKKGTR